MPPRPTVVVRAGTGVQRIADFVADVQDLIAGRARLIADIQLMSPIQVLSGRGIAFLGRHEQQPSE